MRVHSPLHFPTGRVAPPVDRTHAEGATVPLPALITLGVVALWMALVLAVQLGSQHVMGMTVSESWGFAIGIVSYIALFTGFVLGLVQLVRSESGL